MGILLWLLFGALVGWIASLIVGTDHRQGALGNILVGIAGALIGGFVMNLFGASGVSEFDLRSLLVAVMGAVLLLMVVNSFTRARA